MKYIIEIDILGEITEHIFPDNGDIQNSIHSLIPSSVNYVHPILDDYTMVIQDEFTDELSYNALASILSKSHICGNVLLVSSVYSHGIDDDVSFLTPYMTMRLRTACRDMKNKYITPKDNASVQNSC